MSVFWAMYHTEATQAAVAANQAKRDARDARATVEELEARCDRAMLVCEALWTVVRDRLGVTEQELVERVNDIDLSDGKLDGKVRRPAATCRKCNRNFARRFNRCIYCGEAVRADMLP